MARITSKLQVTVPKAIAHRYGIRPGDEVEFLPAGDAIRVVPHVSRGEPHDRRRRLVLFDRATDRQRARQDGREAALDAERGWERDDLYGRGVAR